jgi:putative Mg2+ transporter-C (MgtC) family protein
MEEFLFPYISTDHTLRLVVAMALGAVIGMERQLQGKPAGFRTIILITVGSALFTILSETIGNAVESGRIASNIVTGIGFLGAGVIFKDDNKISGTTTAATVWAAAAVGMCAGGGNYVLSVIATVFILVVLLAFMPLQSYLESIYETRQYRLVINYEQGNIRKYEQIIRDHKLYILKVDTTKRNNNLICHYTVKGGGRKQDELVELLLNDPAVLEFSF